MKTSSILRAGLFLTFLAALSACGDSGEEGESSASSASSSSATSSSATSSSGSSSASTGGGTTPCGGIVGGSCAETEFCDLDDALICAADANGYCMPRPTGPCTADCPKVCGCDGKDYCNLCEAQAAGTDAKAGPCNK